MKVFEGRSQLLNDLPTLLLFEAFFRLEFETLTQRNARQKLHDNAEVVFGLHYVKHPEDVGVVQHLQYLHLSPYCFFAVEFNHPAL